MMVGGEIFRTRPHPASYTMGAGSFPSDKMAGGGVKRPQHLAPKLKKE